MLPDQWLKLGPCGVGCALARAKEAPKSVVRGQSGSYLIFSPFPHCCFLGEHILTVVVCSSWESGLSSFPPSHITSHARTDGWAGAQETDWQDTRGRWQYLQSLVLGKREKEGERLGSLFFFFFYLLPLIARDFVPWEGSGSTWHSVLEGAERCRKAAGRARSKKDQFSGLCWVKD